MMMRAVGTRGRSLVEVLIEMAIIVVLAPAIVCCIVQGITTIAAIALPWLAVTLIVIGLAACFAAVLTSYRGTPSNMAPSPDAGVPLLPPIRRPPGIPSPQEQGRGRREG
jgi:hypothetical protein